MALGINDQKISYLKGTVRGKNIKIYKKDIEELGNNIIKNGVIYDTEKLTEVLSAFADKNIKKNTYVNIVIDYDNFLLREIIVPKSKGKNLIQIIKNETISSLGVLDDYLMDYIILSENKKAKTYNVLVFALNKQIFKDYYEVLKNANIQINSIDIAANCMAKLYSFVEKRDKAFVTMTIYEEKINLLLIEDGCSILSRDIKISLKNFRENNALVIAYEEIANNINKILQFQKTRNKVNEIKKLYIAGGSDEMENFDEIIYSGTSLNCVPFIKQNWLMTKYEFDVEDYINTLGALIRR